MKKLARQGLSLVMSFLMTFSVFFFDFSVSNAEETNHIWTKVSLSDIKADDSIAITMTKDGTTYVLPSKASSKVPPVQVGTVKDGKLTISEGSDSDYVWKITKNTITKTVKNNQVNNSATDGDDLTLGSVSGNDSGNQGSTGFGDSNNSGSSNNSGDDNSNQSGTGDSTTGGNQSGDNSAQTGNNQSTDNNGNTGNLGTTNDGNNQNADNSTTGDGADPDVTNANGTDPDVTDPDGADPDTSANDPADDETTVTEEYYTITSGSNYLYTTAANNGTRVGSKPENEVGAKWKINNGYLATEDSQGAIRQLGVYNSQDFRAYVKPENADVHRNISGQTLAFYKLTSQSANASAIAEPIASIEEGDVAYGTEIELTCDTEGADIYYNTNGTENYSPYSEPIKITNATTIYAYAAKDGQESNHVTFEYTLKKGTKITDLEGLKAGVEFSIVRDAKNALSYEANGKYLSSIDVEVNEGVLALMDESAKLGSLKLEKVEDKDDEFYISRTYIDADSNEVTEYLTTTATGNSLSLSKEKTELGQWTVIEEDGDFLFKNVKAVYHDKNVNADLPQYIEYYESNGNRRFTTYSYKEAKKADFILSAYVALDGEEEEPEVPKENTVAKLLKRELYPGDEIVVYYPKDKKLMTSEKNGGKYTAVDAEPTSEETIDVKDKNALVLKVSVDENGNLKLQDSEQNYLTATLTQVENNGRKSTQCGLALSKDLTEASLWAVKAADENKTGNYILENVNSKNGSYPLALEYFSGFTSYGINKYDDSKFFFNFYALKEGEKVEKLESDPTTELIVAQWAGNANYKDAKSDSNNTDLYIYGDRYETNDLKDTKSKYQVVVGGNPSKPYTSTTSSQTGSTNYYMGSKGVVKDNDYIQMEFPTLGYADMQMSFRIRSSNTAAGAYQLQYSTKDEAGTFKNFTKGSYSYKKTVWVNGKSEEKADNGAISDGVAKTSFAPAEYVSFDFEIPAAANNKEKVYVRLVPCTDKSAKGDGNASAEGVNRIDSVKVMGHPIVSDSICGHVVANPASGEVALGTKVTLSSKTEGAEIFYSLNGGEEVKYDPSKKVTLNEFPAIIRAYAKKDGLQNSVDCVYQYNQCQVAPVKAKPNGGAVAANQKITLSTKTEGATILYRYRTKAEIAKDKTTSSQQDSDDSSSDEVHNDWAEYTGPFELEELPAQIQVKAVKEGYLDSVVSTLKFTKKNNERENIYFGQIHAHTSISDGAGTLEDAFRYASKVDNLDFIFITDHSNSIDNEADSKITENVDKSDSDEWTYAHNLAKQYTTDDFTCGYGYEMTWSNGLGHMNTFNTPGFQSRTQKEFSTYDTALNKYYAALRTVPDSISQFNHPGTTFGDFQDFAYFSEENDALITMIEVGNGEGAIGSSGYFPSYEYYTRALDKGWHVAPTNNQDNHKGKWGDANTGRTVMLADTNDEEAIYDAMRNYRIYATEDNDLSIYYTLDGYVMGSILEKDDVDDTVELKADIKDPTDSAIGKVEVVVNGGRVIDYKNVDKAQATVTFNVPADYSYYYLKITEGDKDIAVTAPVWVGEVEACGINDTYTNTVLPVQGEDLDVNVEFYNNEKTPLTIDNINIVASDVDGKKTNVVNVSGADAKVKQIASNSTATYTTNFVYNQAGQVTYEVTVDATLNGVKKTYTDKLYVNYAVPNMVANVIIDGTHYGDYVTGYYGGNVNAFVSLCAKKNIRALVEKEEITPEMLEDCKLLVLSAPAKKSGTATAGDYSVSHYSDEFLDMVKAYVESGGSVIVCGLADYSDSTNCQTATEQNKLLSAIGATIRMGSDEVCDDTNNGGQVYRMYPTNVNLDSPYLKGFKEGQKYSQYSGCSVDISSATATDFVDEAEWLVRGFDTTYSVDCKDASGNAISGVLPNGVKGAKNDNQGDIVFLARQKTKAGGQIIVAGGVFISDFEIKAEMDNNDSLPYANHTIVNNLLEETEVQLPTTTIAEARKGNMNDVFAVEGYVTSGTENQDTTFFDTIYIQDETGGMDIFPYATPGLKIGTKVRVVGFLAKYQGDLELKVLSTKILEDEPKIWEPKVVDTKTAMDYENLGGQLLQTTGQVTRVTFNADGTVEEFWLKDSTGAEAAIFIDGYIKSGTTGQNTVGDFVKVGAKVTAAGVLYMHPEGDSDVSVPVFRVRNCDDIRLATADEISGSNGGQASGGGQTSGGSGSSSSGNGTGAAVTSGTVVEDETTPDDINTTGNQDITSQTGTGHGHNNHGNGGNGGNGQTADNGNSDDIVNTDTPSQTDDTKIQDNNGNNEQSAIDTNGKTKFPVVPVAVGFGIIVVGAVVIKLSLGASVVSGGKLASIIAKIKSLFGK